MTRTLLRALSSILIIAGSLLVVDAAITLAWQEPMTAIYARIQQDRLGGEVDKLTRALPPVTVRRALARVDGSPRRIALLARAERRDVHAGDGIGRIDIPRIGASYVVVQGVDSASLQKGPGHDPGTAMPGLHGTVYIAGHRTTYLAPFRHVDKLRKGDRITLKMPYGLFTYSVERTRIVTPDAVWIRNDVGHDQLVISACHPVFSASHRIVLFARQIAAAPRGAALTS